MRANRLVSTLLTLLVLAACAGGPPPEPPAPVFDPAGSWSFIVEVQGQTMNGTMRISGSEEAGWRGSLNSEMGEAVMSGIRLMGMTLRFSLPDVNGASGRIDFAGDAFEGELSTEMGMIPIRGTRR